RLKSRRAFFRSAARRRPSGAMNRNSSASAITDRSNVRYRWRALKKTRPKQISRMASCDDSEIGAVKSQRQAGTYQHQLTPEGGGVAPPPSPQAHSNSSLDERSKRRQEMSKADRTAKCADSFFHPVSHYESPDGVLNDPELSTDEKRVILSSWASDMYVVESHPALREIPGIPHRLRLDDILAALKQLDDENDPPPRGGLAMRLPRFSKLERTASDESQPSIDGRAATRQCRPAQPSRTHRHSRWTREANVRRYRKLLNTQLTDIERSFMQRRLAEELQA